MLTHDPAEARAYENDPQIFRQIAVNVLLDLHDTATRLIDDAAAITTPTLILAASSDWIVKMPAQRKFFQRLGSPIKQFEILQGFSHAIFHERDRQVVIDKVRGFILRSFEQAWHHNGLLESDQGGFTRTEYDLLRTPGGVQWPVISDDAENRRAALSGRIRLGWESGFDSGMTLDYVYENGACGVDADWEVG